MRTACVVLLVFSFLALPQPTLANLEGDERQRTIEAVERYLNAITTLDATFDQINPDETVNTGRFLIKRPHFARLSYDHSDTLFISRGQRFMFRDGETMEIMEGSISDTPVHVLMRPDVKLDEDVYAIEVQRQNDEIIMVLMDIENPGAGAFALVLKEDPVRLTRWIVKDAQGLITRVTLTRVETGVEIDDELFVIDKDGRLSSP